MMKETNIHSQVTSTIAGDDGEAVAKSEENAKKKVPEKPNEASFTKLDSLKKGVIRVNPGGVEQPSFQHPDTDTPLE